MLPLFATQIAQQYPVEYAAGLCVSTLLALHITGPWVGWAIDWVRRRIGGGAL